MYISYFLSFTLFTLGVDLGTTMEIIKVVYVIIIFHLKIVNAFFLQQESSGDKAVTVIYADSTNLMTSNVVPRFTPNIYKL